jgi:hypothetical protein
MKTLRFASLVFAASSTLLVPIAAANLGVREVTSSSCEIVRVNLGLGMTTQIVFEEEPKVTLYADKKHFKISTNSLSPRSLAVIPLADAQDLNAFRDPSGQLPLPETLAEDLDKSFKTNLFVFFKNNNQLMFELRFVEKKKADYILKVTEDFKKDCVL